MNLCLLLLLTSTTAQEVEPLPKLTEPQRASLLALARKMDRPDVVEFMAHSETKLVFLCRGDVGLYFANGWRVDNPAFGSLAFEVAKPMDRVTGLDLSRIRIYSSEPDRTEGQLSARAEEIAKRFVGTTPLVRVQREKDTLAAGVQFDYYLQGSTREGSDHLSLFLHPQTAQVIVAYPPFAREDEHYDGNRTLALNLLEGRALSLYADARPFPQGEVVGSYLHVRVPVPYGTFNHDEMRPPTQGLAARLFSPQVNAGYIEMWRRKQAIPLYVLRVESPDPRRSYGVILDARNGNLLFTNGNVGLGGSEPKTPPSLPDRAAVDGMSGSLAKRPESSPTPQGAPVVLTTKRRVLAGRFDAKSGSLWLRRTEQEPYRAFRPDAKLRKALEAQVKRNAALAKKEVRPG